MRWRTLANILLAGSVLADQRPFEAHGDDSVDQHTIRKTMIDMLSADKDYTLLLQAIQRARLVPTLNRINGSTLFAPTNAAIERYAESHPDSAWASLLDEQNPHNDLRQHVFYHLLNYTATPTTSQDLPAAPATYTHKTLHFPQAPEDGSGPPSHEPPNLPPWMPVPGGLLAGEPQRVRVTWKDDAAWVAVSEQGQDGVKVVKNDVVASNGRIVGIDDVIPLPINLVDVIRDHPKLKTLSRYITPTIERTLAKTPHLTLFVPDDKAWDALKPMEKLWLDSGYAERDLMDIFARHATTGEKPHEESGFADDIKVGWSEYWGSESAYQSLTDSKLQLTTHSDGTTVVNDGTATVLQKDVYASNGVLHTLDSLLVPPGSPLFQATAEKWLLALNASVFVGMIREAGLDSYVNGTGKHKEWTILAPADDVLDDILQRRDRSLYLPPDAMKAALGSLEHTTFTSLLYSSGLNISRPATTLLVPINEAFAARGLAIKWLMMDDVDAQTGLKRVLMHHLLEGVVVGKDLWFEGASANMATPDEGGNGKKKSWGTVEGSDVRVSKKGDSLLIEASGPDESPLPLTVLDTLTLTGALHEVSGVLWPRSVRVGILPVPLAEKDGGVGAKDSTSVGWADWILSRLIQPERGIENLLNGEYAQSPPRPRPRSNIVTSGATVPFEPDAETPLPLQSPTARFGTLQTSHSTYGDIVFAHTGDHGWAVTVKGAEEWSGVKAWGKTIGVTPGAASVLAGDSPLTGGVIQIDRVLEPYSPSWWHEWVPALGVGAAGVATIGLLFWGVVWVWKRDVQEATYEPADGDEDE
ncbi:hypothetical protein RSAG8_07439, partial [Rhizoctonia solani AG-8 WAC10335]